MDGKRRKMLLKNTYSATDHDENPCHYCTAADGRDENCHAECFDYFLWEIVQEERRKERQRAAEERENYIDYINNILTEYRRKNRRK